MMGPDVADCNAPTALPGRQPPSGVESPFWHERVVQTASCPVLTVRHPEHEFVLPDALVTASVLHNEVARSL